MKTILVFTLRAHSAALHASKIVPDSVTPGFLPFAPSGPPALRYGVQNCSRQFCVELSIGF